MPRTHQRDPLSTPGLLPTSAVFRGTFPPARGHFSAAPAAPGVPQSSPKRPFRQLLRRPGMRGPAAALLAVLLAAAVSPARPQASAAAFAAQYASTWNENIVWECLTGTSMPMTSGGATIAATASAAVPAAVVEAAVSSVKSSGAEVTGVYGNHVSMRATPAQVASSAVQGACLHAFESQRATNAQLTVVQGGANVAVQLNTLQGARAMRANKLIAENPFLNGAGIKVGILSNSYNFTGVLSPCDAVNRAVVLKDFLEWNTSAPDHLLKADEGRAMAELVCFLAPEAQIYFYTAWLGEADFAKGILELTDAGCNVIVDDMVYYTESEYSPGIISQAIEKAKAKGVAYFTATGNTANWAWEGKAFWVERAGRSLHDFGRILANSPPMLSLRINVAFAGQDDTAAAGDDGQRLTLLLQWDEPFYSYTTGLAWPQSDIDLHACPSERFGEGCISSEEDNNGNGTHPGSRPVEQIKLPRGDWWIFIQLKDTTRDPAVPHALKLYWFGGELRVPSGQGINGRGAARIVPHANTADAMAVGATMYSETPGYGINPPRLDWYSSWGGTPQYLSARGARLPEPVVLKKPDVVGPAFADTSFFPPTGDPDQDFEGNGWPNFAGTSSAAPQVAGIAALTLQHRPNLQPDDLYDLIRSTAVDIRPDGYDPQSGFGFIAANKVLPRGNETKVDQWCMGKRPGDPCTSRCREGDSTCSRSGQCLGTGADRQCRNSEWGRGSCYEAAGRCLPSTGECVFAPKPKGATCRLHKRCRRCRSAAADPAEASEPAIRATCDGKGNCVPNKPCC